MSQRGSTSGSSDPVTPSGPRKPMSFPKKVCSPFRVFLFPPVMIMLSCSLTVTPGPVFTDLRP